MATFAPLHQQTTILIAAESSGGFHGFPPQSTAMVIQRFAGESSIVRKLFLSVLIVLLALGAFSVTYAQDKLPWGADPGGDSDTQEFNPLIPQSVQPGQCIQFDFSIAIAPKSLRVFVQLGVNDRYSTEVLPLLTRSLIGQHSLCIKLEQLGLENPSNGAVDHSKPFDPSVGKISGVGIHVWDDTRSVSMAVSQLAIVPVQQSTVASATFAPSTTWCTATAEPKVMQGGNYIDFTSKMNVTVIPHWMLIFSGNDNITLVGGDWQGYKDGVNRFKIGVPVDELNNWLDPNMWALFFPCP